MSTSSYVTDIVYSYGKQSSDLEHIRKMTSAILNKSNPSFENISDESKKSIADIDSKFGSNEIMAKLVRIQALLHDGEKYSRKISDELITLRRRLQSDENKGKKVIQDKETIILNLESNTKELETQIGILQKALEESNETKSKLAVELKEVETKLSEQMKEASKIAENFQNDLTRMEETHLNMEKKIKDNNIDHTNEINKYKLELKSLEETMSLRDQSLSEKQDIISTLTSQKNDLEQKLSQQLASETSLLASKQTFDNQYFNVKQELETAKSQVQDLRTKHLEAINKMKDQLVAVQTQLSEVTRLKEESSTSLEQNSQKLQDMSKQLEKEIADKEELKEKNNRLMELNNALDNKIEEVYTQQKVIHLMKQLRSIYQSGGYMNLAWIINDLEQNPFTISSSSSSSSSSSKLPKFEGTLEFFQNARKNISDEDESLRDFNQTCKTTLESKSTYPITNIKRTFVDTINSIQFYDPENPNEKHKIAKFDIVFNENCQNTDIKNDLILRIIDMHLTVSLPSNILTFVGIGDPVFTINQNVDGVVKKYMFARSPGSLAHMIVERMFQKQNSQPVNVKIEIKYLTNASTTIGNANEEILFNNIEEWKKSLVLKKLDKSPNYMHIMSISQKAELEGDPDVTYLLIYIPPYKHINDDHLETISELINSTTSNPMTYQKQMGMYPTKTVAPNSMSNAIVRFIDIGPRTRQDKIYPTILLSPFSLSNKLDLSKKRIDMLEKITQTRK